VAQAEHRQQQPQVRDRNGPHRVCRIANDEEVQGSSTSPNSGTVAANAT
jgi:hypothetical protein